MYKRQITVNPAHPENALPTYSIGMMSAGILAIDGIPQNATEVRFLVTKPQISGAAFEFETRKVGTRWEVTFPQDEFLTVGEGSYEVKFTARASFWAAKGKFIVLKTYNGGIVPPAEAPDLPHYFVVSINDIKPDDYGNVNLAPIINPIIARINAIHEVPDLSELNPLLPGDSDRATKNLLNALLNKLKGPIANA